MTKLRFLLAALVLCFCSTLVAQAQIQRTFVSTTGTDAGNCVPSAPCRSFNYALTQTAAGGEVLALTTGGYGPMTITQSVSIISPDGIYAGITAFSGDAVTINAPGEVVVLRGLNINRQGTGNIGITVTAVGVLHVERCVVSGFASTGIRALLTASADIFIKETIVRNNAGSGISIIGPTGSGTVARVSMVNTRSERNGSTGFSFLGNVEGTLDRCLSSGNTGIGFTVATTASGTVAEVNAESCVASNNSSGFLVTSSTGGGTARLRVARSVATNNITGFRQFGTTSVFRVLAGTNLVEGNGTDKDGTITAVGTDTNP